MVNSGVRFIHRNYLRNNEIVFLIKLHIRIDFGQPPRRGLVNSVDKLRDEVTQRPIAFNSAIDALNFMNEQGWELVQIYNRDSCDARYVMRRSLAQSAVYETNPR